MILLHFFIWRIVSFAISYAAPLFVPYLGFFPYKELLVEFGLPTWVSSLANFDGIHYLLIAKQNYSQWEQAFFPFYPLLIKTVSFVVPNYLVSSLFISNICFAIGLVYFQKLMKGWGAKTIWPMLLLLCFPTAFYFGAVYTEGLFFMLFVLSLYYLHKKNYWLAGLFGALSSATRLIGIFLIIPFLLNFISENIISFKNYKLKIKNLSVVLFSPLLGLLCYMAYLYVTTGDPLFFFNSQPIYGANRSTHLILLPQVYFRYFKILFTAVHDFQWYLSLFEMSIFTLILFILILDFIKIISSSLSSRAKSRDLAKRATLLDFSLIVRNDSVLMSRLGVNIFSLINIILPTLTGTFSSIPRYALFSLSFFLYLGQIKSHTVKIAIAGIFIIMQIGLLSFFIQGYFVG